MLDQGTMSLVELARSLKPELVGDWPSKLQELDRRFERNCTMKKYRVLAHLMAHGKARAHEIADSIGIKAAEVRSYLSSLLQDNLVSYDDTDDQQSSGGWTWKPVRGHDDSL